MYLNIIRCVGAVLFFASNFKLSSLTFAGRVRRKSLRLHPKGIVTGMLSRVGLKPDAEGPDLRMQAV